MIQIKRVYAPVEAKDGSRFLVERLWPRGIKKETLSIVSWCKEIAPSKALREWFGHDPRKWEGFKQRYSAELESHKDQLQPLIEAARKGNVTLLYSARDTEHNSALLLKSYLEQRKDNSQ